MKMFKAVCFNQSGGKYDRHVKAYNLAEATSKIEKENHASFIVGELYN